MSATMRASLWAACMLAAATMPAVAGCSRAIDVPMAPIGLSVGFDGERATGLYPTLLRELAAGTGCEFMMRRVPRARLQKMYESAQADILIPASATPSRDADGEFVPLIQVRASLVALGRDKPAPRSLAELVAQPDYKLAVVRGFSFGPAYDNAVATLRAQKRLVEEPDPIGVARALRQGLAQGTVMTATIIVSTLVMNPEFAPMDKQLRLDPLEELGWTESGLYLSRLTLNDADRRTLRQAFGQAAKAGRVWQLFNETYPAGSLAGSIRPL